MAAGVNTAQQYAFQPTVGQQDFSDESADKSDKGQHFEENTDFTGSDPARNWFGMFEGLSKSVGSDSSAFNESAVSAQSRDGMREGYPHTIDHLLSRQAKLHENAVSPPEVVRQEASHETESPLKVSQQDFIPPEKEASIEKETKTGSVIAKDEVLDFKELFQLLEQLMARLNLQGEQADQLHLKKMRLYAQAGELALQDGQHDIRGSGGESKRAAFWDGLGSFAGECLKVTGSALRGNEPFLLLGNNGIGALSISGGRLSAAHWNGNAQTLSFLGNTVSNNATSRFMELERLLREAIAATSQQRKDRVQGDNSLGQTLSRGFGPNQ